MTSDNQEHFQLRCIIWAQTALMLMLCPEYPEAKNEYLSALIGLVVRYCKTFQVTNHAQMRESDLAISQIRAELETIDAASRSFLAKFFLASEFGPYGPNGAKEIVQSIVNAEINPEATRKKPHLRVVR